MAKGPGWYDDPWSGTGQRWWDGKNWTEHVQGQPGAGFAPGVTVGGRPLITAPEDKWYYQWWFIAIMLFPCSGCVGLILTWMRPNTPASIKLVVTVLYLVLQVLIAAALYSLFPEFYDMSSTG